MKSSNTKNTIKKLIPVLSKIEKEEMIAYYTVYEKYSSDFSKKAKENLLDHPVFGKLISDIPQDTSEANDKLSRELQKDAIVNDNWEPYVEYQIEQGILYANMGLDFKSWYEIIVMMKNFIRPLLHQEYESGEKLFSSLSGMNRFLDIAMCIIGEAYIQAKEEIILNDREKIKKLNEELEQKVIERTSQLERNIQQLKEYQHFFLNTNDLCGIANTEGFFEIINTNFNKTLGYSENEFCETPFVELIHPDDVSATLLEYEKLKSGALVINFINRYRKKDGNYLFLDWNATPNPVTKKLYCVARDITERKKFEEQLLSVNNELEAFSYSVSHDLRAPLRAVNGYAQMLTEDYSPKLDEEGKRIIEAIKYNSTKMGRLIDDLLDFSRLGRKDVQKSNIDMNQLTDGVLSDLSKSVEFNAEIKVGKLHDAYADYSLLHQVMFNVISNAVKYSSKKKHPIVEISSEQMNDEIVFSVKDNGVGFDMQYAHKLFGVFQRLHKTKDFEGTGVGLAIVQRIIYKHGGKVWVRAELDKGATFYFTIPKNQKK